MAERLTQHIQTVRTAMPWLRRVMAACAAVLLVAFAPEAPEPAGDSSAPPVGPTAVPAARQATNVAVITIHEAIDSVTARSVIRRIKVAESAGAEAIVIDLDTPGGEVGAVLEISNAIKGTSVPNTVAWINDTAYSGGAIIAFACREIVAADQSVMGDALVVSLIALPEAERQKVTVTLIGEVVNSARLRGWDEFLVQAVVSRFIELWYVEHVETGERLCINENEYRMLFDDEPPRGSAKLASASPNPDAPQAPSFGLTEDKPDVDVADDAPAYTPPTDVYADEGDVARVRNLLERPSERPLLSEGDRGSYKVVAYVCDGNAAVVFEKAGPVDDLAYFGMLSATVDNDEDLKTFFGATTVRRLDPSWSEGVVRFLISPWIRGLLIVVFIIGMFLEMSAPGTGVPGAVAALALVTLLAPPYLAGMAGWWEIVAILIGVAALGIEIFVLPGFGVFGVLGILALFIGLLGTFVPDQSGSLFPNSPQAERDVLLGAATVIMAFVTAGGIAFFISKKTGGLPLFDRLVLKNPEPGDEDTPLSVLRAPEQPAQKGDTGVAHTDLRPSGEADINGRLVDVVSGLGYIERGTPVRVTRVESFRVVVEADDPINTDPSNTAGETHA